MIQYKTKAEIEIMQEGGAKLVQVFDLVGSKLKTGMTTREVDNIAEREITRLGGTPSFKKVSGYHDTICISINDQVVHTPPSDKVINDGDIVTVDIGFFYKGFNTDKAITYFIGKSSDCDTTKFLNAGKKALQKAIEVAVCGNYIGDISATIGTIIEEEEGYHIVRELTGHGVGKILHEDPAIPGFLNSKRKRTSPIKPGMTLAIEVIYAKGTSKFVNEKGNNWSLVTSDGSVSACFEHTIAVLEHSTLILA